MDINYLKIIDGLSFAKSDIEGLFEKAQSGEKGFENRQAYHIVENILGDIDTALYKLKRYSSPAIEGILQEDRERKKFELIRNDNGKSLGWFFSCGDYLEVYDRESEEWYTGRVEHTTREGQKGYYFFNNDLDNPFLYTGMVCRVRKQE
jgi:hypothetical protein